jgi:hypothetical protein
MEKKTVFILAMLWILTTNVHAEVITIFDSNSIITDANSFDTVVVKGDGTVVEMTGGDINTVITMNASTFNMLGGTIEPTNFKGIKAYDSSRLNLLGGSIQDIQSYGENQITISGDATITGDNNRFYGSSVITVSSLNVIISGLSLRDEAKLEFLAGTVTNGIDCQSYNEVNISGGQINRIDVSMNTEEDIGTTTLNISGGTVNSVGIYGEFVNNFSPIVRLSGGVIDDIDVWAYRSNIGFIGYGLDMVPYGGSEGYGQLTGYWNNDVYFSIDFMNRRTYSSLTLYDGVIPANCVSKPISDLSGDCKVNFIDLSKMAFEWLDDGTE